MNLGSFGSVLGRIGNTMLQQHGGMMGGMMGGGGGIFGLLSQHPELLQKLFGGGAQGGNYLNQPMGMYGENLNLGAGPPGMGFYGQNLNLGA